MPRSGQPAENPARRFRERLPANLEQIAGTRLARCGAFVNVLKLSYEFPPIGGGGSQVVAGLSRELVRSGHTVDVVTMAFDGLPRREAVDGVAVQRVACVRRRELQCSMFEAATYAASALPVVRRLVRRQRPDLVHAHFIFPDGLIAWRATRELNVPFIITAHGTDVPGYNPHRARTAHRLLRPLWKRVTEAAAAIVCPSEDLAEKVQRQQVRARVLVIPNGIDPERFEDRAKQRRVLVVSRMVERKGFQFFLEAIREMELDHEVHIVGDGPFLPKLKEIAGTVRTPIKFWGRLPNDSYKLAELYETSSIYVFPSESENFPIVLLEAMASRNAVITSRGTGCEEVVGDAGVLVTPKDPASIREALLPLLSDAERCRSLGQAARRRVEENFSWTAVTERYLSLYEKQLHA